MSEDKKILETVEDVEFELSDEDLDGITGGFIYHDEGDASAHRKEAYYVLDDTGRIIMKVKSLELAQHWTKNLRTSSQLLTPEEFEKLRRGE